MKPLFIAISLGFLLCGCGTNHFIAPPGREIYMLTQDDPVTVREVAHVWYAGWGTWALGENTSVTAIERNHLQEVRYSTEQGFVDTILTTFTTVLSFSRRTIVVEGNPFLSCKEIPQEDQVPKTTWDILEEKIN